MGNAVQFDPTLASDFQSIRAALAPADLLVSLATLDSSEDIVSDATLKLVATDNVGNRAVIFLYDAPTLTRIDPSGLKTVVDREWPGRSLVLVHGRNRSLNTMVRELLMKWEPDKAP